LQHLFGIIGRRRLCQKRQAERLRYFVHADRLLCNGSHVAFAMRIPGASKGKIRFTAAFGEEIGWLDIQGINATPQVPLTHTTLETHCRGKSPPESASELPLIALKE
jgi:hypothetical protein